jgi:hypothetical protein
VGWQSVLGVGWFGEGIISSDGNTGVIFLSSLVRILKAFGNSHMGFQYWVWTILSTKACGNTKRLFYSASSAKTPVVYPIALFFLTLPPVILAGCFFFDMP